MSKILVAEDERDILDLITFTLEYGGHKVIPSSNGAEALELTRQEKPDLVLLDVRMPCMTGFEVCEYLKSEESTKSIPVVFLSAKGQEVEVNTGYEVGAVDYILKPFAPDQLLENLEEILNQSASGLN